MNKTISEIILESSALKQKLAEDDGMIRLIDTIVQLLTHAYRNDKKVLFCGNGGSAADAQHLAAELSGRFYTDRDPLYAEALHVNTSYLTAVANDYSYDEVYARLVKAKGRSGDILIGISTSGNSGNIIRAIDTAKNQGMITIGMTGESGGRMNENCDYIIRIPSKDTPRIQECHILIGHIICELVERNLFSEGK